MDEPRPILWRRTGRLRLRRLTLADLPGLYQIAAAGPDGLRVLEPWTSRERARALIERAPADQLAVELDAELIGAALASPCAEAPDAAQQPWTPLSAPFEPRGGLEPAGPYLLGRGLLWRDVLDDAQTDRILTLARKGLVQRRGYETLYSLARPQAYASWREAMPPAAYLQQVHAWSIDDPGLTPWLRAGFLMRGWFARGGQMEIVMTWANRAR